MRFRLFLFLLPIIFISRISASVPATDKYIEFLAGFMLIQSTDNITEQQKTRYFVQLQSVSGVTSKDAVAFVNKFRNKPDEWQKIQKQVAELIDKKEPEKTEPNKIDNKTNGSSKIPNESPIKKKE